MVIGLEHEDPRWLSCRWLIFCLPFLSVFMSASAYTVSYIISIKLGNIDPLPFIPFLSDIGQSQPQSSMFTLGLCLSSILTLTVVIIRFHQVKCIYNNEPIKLNGISVYIGCTFVFGKLITACYQISSNKMIHCAGAAIYFIGAFGYAVTQLYLTRNFLLSTNKCIKSFRTICCVFMLLSMLLFAFFLIPALNIYNRSGYSIAQIAEWALVLAKSAFMLTFTYDFWKIGIYIEVDNISKEAVLQRRRLQRCSRSQRSFISTYAESNRKSYMKEPSVQNGGGMYDSVYFDETPTNSPRQVKKPDEESEGLYDSVYFDDTASVRL